MAVTIRNLAGNAFVPTPIGPLFTASAQEVIRAAVFCNFTASTQTATIYKVPSGMSVSAQNLIYGPLTVSANTTVIATALLNQVFDAGDSLQAVASLSASITVNIAGSRAT